MYCISRFFSIQLQISHAYRLDLNFERRRYSSNAAYRQSKQADRMLSWAAGEFECCRRGFLQRSPSIRIRTYFGLKHFQSVTLTEFFADIHLRLCVNIEGIAYFVCIFAAWSRRVTWDFMLNFISFKFLWLGWAVLTHRSIVRFSQTQVLVLQNECASRRETCNLLKLPSLHFSYISGVTNCGSTRILASHSSNPENIFGPCEFPNLECRTLRIPRPKTIIPWKAHRTSGKWPWKSTTLFVFNY